MCIVIYLGSDLIIACSRTSVIQTCVQWTMPIRSSRQATGQLDLGLLFVHGMGWLGKMAWVICKKEKST